MEAQELTQIVTAHQQVIVRSENRLDRIEELLERSAQQHQQEMADIRAQQHLNAQDIGELKASILELRNLVADYIQSRNQTE